METNRQVIFPGTVSILIFSLLFFIVRNFYQEQYDTTQKELDGIKNISVIYNISALIKHNMFLNQIEPNIKNYLENKSFVSNAKILQELKKVNNSEAKVYFSSLVEKEKKLSKVRINEEYRVILKFLEDENLNITDQSSLFLESQRDTAFLISIIVRIIPEALKNIKNLTDIKVNSLYGDKKQEYYKFMLEDNINKFLLNIKNISQILMKIRTSDSSSLYRVLDSTISKFKTLETSVLNAKQGDNEQTSIDYFLQLSNINNSVNTLFETTKKLIVNKLQERKKDIDFKLRNGTFLYALVIILTLMVMYRNYYKSNKLLKEVSKKNTDDKYIAELKEMLLESSTLKDVCEISILQLVKRFGAISGILYIYDDNNYKLYLGGTYGLDPLSVDCTLCIHNNLIGDCIIDHELKITDSNLELNHDNKQIKVHQTVTIPLFNLDKSIGAVQLYFDNSFDENEIGFLQRVMYIMSNNIYQSEQDNAIEDYLKLIDKNIMVVKADLNGDILDVSEEFCNLSGYTKEELIGQNHRIFRHEETPEILYVELWGSIKQGLVWRGEIKNRTKDGKYYWADNIIAPNIDMNGTIIGYTGIKHDITNKKLVEELSITDALTELYNRRHFDKVLKNNLLIALRENKKLVLAIADIDYFKQYNDTYGHQAGDRALIAVANCIKYKLSRPNDYCFRIGGEEFAILYYCKNEYCAADFLNTIKQSVENLYIPHDGHYSSKYITISIGAKLIEGEDLRSAENAFNEADKALYIAKDAGRNIVITV
ncbi:MAG: diguanylate cyclase [Sulfurimonas sp.]|nr:diguanylate cyclase [Sulfurimonas sp.]